jgi:hypothetical protein
MRRIKRGILQIQRNIRTIGIDRQEGVLPNYVSIHFRRKYDPLCHN